jgi:hypothetical protein
MGRDGRTVRDVEITRHALQDFDRLVAHRRNEGPEDDVGPAIPTLAAAAAPYFAGNSGASRHMIGDQETLVKYVRGDIPALTSRK